ncbi:uncharacterized protein LOC131153923 [Malania oleifera]|uniref:uncharacterized protein LOC131153923 n=1 Tax=Malania oleifera TaxID=397392 RepID=UPI0025AD9FA8|nr:uncharacterized protein LOC131153923 [Malania oleifera]
MCFPLSTLSNSVEGICSFIDSSGFSTTQTARPRDAQRNSPAKPKAPSEFHLLLYISRADNSIDNQRDAQRKSEPPPLMACATTRPAFSFHPSSSLSQPSLQKPKPHLTIPPLIPKTHPISAILRRPKTQFTSKSIDVSKEDKPVSGQPDSPTTPSTDSPPIPVEPENFDKRRLEEKFAVLNTGIYECRSCGFRYDEAAGDPSYPIPPGLEFDKLPEDWRCPTCGAAKSFFESKSVEIAGFAQNQQFGLGGNALTSGQKALLIYGSLLFFFALFLSGYFLQ